MAVDNFERWKAVNAIVEAWVRYGSLPFLTRKQINAGSSATFTTAHPFEGVIVALGMNTGTTGIYTLKINASGGNAYIKTITSASGLTVSWSGNVLTIANAGSVSTAIYIMSLIGSVE